MHSRGRPKHLSELETRVMEILWTREECSADEVRRGLARTHELTDSSIRTLLRRLETKGYASHIRDGKRFLYRPSKERQHVAAAAARKIIDTICGGKADALLLGLLESGIISSDEIAELQKRLDSQHVGGKKSR